MTKDRYLNMCEQLDQKPDPEKMPPGIEDFPDFVIEAMNTYNGLGDNRATVFIHLFTNWGIGATIDIITYFIKVTINFA